MERDLCYALLKSMVEVAKCLLEITEGSDKEPVKIDKTSAENAKTPIVKDQSSIGNEIDIIGEEAIADSVDDVQEEEVCESSADEDVHASPHLDFDAILKPATHLLTQDLPFRSVDVWKHFWLECSGFRSVFIAI